MTRAASRGIGGETIDVGARGGDERAPDVRRAAPTSATVAAGDGLTQ